MKISINIELDDVSEFLVDVVKSLPYASRKELIALVSSYIPH